MQMRPTFTLAGFARAEFVELQNVAALDQHHIANRTVHGCGHLGVQLELAVFAVDGNEISRLDQIDDELEFFLAGVSADVNWRGGAVFVDDVGFAAEQVVDHPVDRFLVTGNDSRRKHDRVALFDFCVLVVVHGGARERGHRLALGSADQDANFFRREILHLTGIDHAGRREPRCSPGLRRFPTSCSWSGR